jgi:hypothetical protein
MFERAPATNDYRFTDLLPPNPNLRKSVSVHVGRDLIASHHFEFIFRKKRFVASHRRRQIVRTVLCLVTCGSLIHCVLRNLQGRTNNASEGGSPDVSPPMPKSVGHFGEYSESRVFVYF